MDVDELLRLSRSAAWSDRADAGRELSAFAGSLEVDAALGRLLLDIGDTAVIDATAEALLRRGDVVALRLFAAAWASAEGETSDHLYGCLSGHLYELSCAAPEDRIRYRMMLRQLLASPDVAVRAGAQGLLDQVARALPD
ncbi:hypothetical protein ACN27G_31245 [Plantactinospora sp. WMMB334]|uniref:hypothetical protein n=1 Tax=Plantactinospora sp. WMMB334 TaxID=3404119 RepID=UPI003B92B865